MVTLKATEKPAKRLRGNIMRRFGTRGPVNPEQHYIVARTEELTEFIKRVKFARRNLDRAHVIERIYSIMSSCGLEAVA